MSRRPNFIFLIADDHRSGAIGCHGCAEVATPHLDALAARGVDYTQAHCQGGFNPAVCVPSRASLMTGRNVSELNADPVEGQPYYGPGSVIDPGMVTFPEHLRRAGYQTHAIGKWHNDKATFSRAFSSAENVFFGGMGPHEELPLQDYDPTGVYGDDRGRCKPGHSTEVFADAAIDFITDTADADPFLLYVAFTAPHDPRTPPDGYSPDPATIPVPKAFAPQHAFDNGAMVIRDELLEAFPRSPENIQKHLAEYYGMIAHMDEQIGQILAAAHAKGLLENTVVVYTADHGLGLGNHGLMGKQNVYEHSIHIPLIMAGPTIPQGVKRDDLVWHGDTHATVMGLAGLTADAAVSGVDLRKRMADDTEPKPRRYFSACYKSTQRMVRDERFKLIKYQLLDEDAEMPSMPSGAHLAQLFDLDNDPDELHNLVYLPEYTETYLRLEQALAVQPTWRANSQVLN